DAVGWHGEAVGDRRRNEIGVGDRGERDPGRTVAEVVDARARRRDGEASLARAAGPGERDETVRRQELSELAELRLAPEEARQLGRQGVHPGLEGAQRWELAQEAAGDDLVEAEGLEVLEPVRPEVDQADVAGRRIAEEAPEHVRDDDLAAVGGRLDPGR